MSNLSIELHRILFDKDTINKTIILISYFMIPITIINLIVYLNRTCIGNTTDNNYCQLTVINKKNTCVNRKPLKVNLGFRDLAIYSNFLLFIVSLIFALFFILSIKDNINDIKTYSFTLILIVLFVITTFATLIFITSCYSNPTDCQINAVKDNKNNILVSCKPTNTDSGNLIFISLNMTCLIIPIINLIL